MIAAVLKPLGYKINHFRVTERRLFKRFGIPQMPVTRLKTRINTCIRPFDVNIFLEKIRPELVPLAQTNVLIPNQEVFTVHSIPRLKYIDLVVCKTQYACEIFKQLGAAVEFISFTSENCLVPDRSPRFDRVLHLAGKSSPRRGTVQILDLWRSHPEFPLLTVIAHELESAAYTACRNIKIIDSYLSERAIRVLQNDCGIHLCLSEAEGFGHFIVEALSCGVCVLTTNGAPMNELVQPDRGYLLEPRKVERQVISDRFYFDAADLEQSLLHLMAESDNDKQKKSIAARQWFEQNDRFFRRRLVEVIGQL